MKRLHRSMLTAAVLFGGVGGYGIYVLQTEVKTADVRYLEEQRSQRLFKEEFGLDHVKSGELMTRGTTIAFSLDAENDVWMITSPVEWRGDTEAIEGAINQMVGVKIDPETRVEKPDGEQLATWGLVKPIARLTLDTERGEFSLLVGPKNSIRDMYPITDGEHRLGGLSDRGFFWALDKSLAEFRDRRVFRFSPDEVKSVRRDFLLERTEDGFTVADADGKNIEKADLDRAEIFLAALTQRLRIGRFLTDDYSEEDAKKYGLDRKSVLEVTAKNGDRAVAHVGTVYETGDQEGTAVMHLVGTKTVVEVPDFVHDEMAKTKEDLKDRTLLRLDRKKVTKVEIQQGSETIVVKRSAGGSDWTVTSPRQAPAQVWKMDKVVALFGKLKVERFHQPKATKSELAEWLLDPPSRRIIFYGAEDEVLGDVRIGKYYAEGEVFAKHTGEDRIGILKDTRVTVLPKNLDDLIDRERIE